MPVLRVKSGSNKGHVRPLAADAVVIGRDCPDGIQVLDQGVSRRHAEVFAIGEMYFVRDLQSRNGVFLNDERVVEELLQPGDQIRIGQTVFVFETDGAPGGGVDGDGELAELVQGAGAPKPEVVEFDDEDHEGAYQHTLMLDLDLQGGGHEMLGAAPETVESRHLNTIYQLAKLASGEKSLNNLFSDFLAVVGKAVQADAGYVFVKGAKNNFVPRASWHRDGEAVKDKKPSQSVSTSIVRRVIELGKPILTSDANTDHRFSTARSIVLKQVRSVVCAPLAVRDKVHGALYLNMLRNDRSFSSEDLELVTSLALQIAIATDSIQAAQRQRESLFNIVRAMVGLIEERDPDSRGRSVRVMNITAAIGQAAKLKPEQRYWIELAALLHDVGSLGLHDVAGMSPEQRCEAVVAAGERFVKSLKTFDAILPGIRFQFARFDGTGWPTDADTKHTPLAGKIISLARDFDELNQSVDPATGEPRPVKSILLELRELAGKRYEPQVVQALLVAAKQGILFNPQPVFGQIFSQE